MIPDWVAFGMLTLVLMFGQSTAPCGLFWPVGATRSHGLMAVTINYTHTHTHIYIYIFLAVVASVYYTRILRCISICEWYGV
jgi:hypothetical protein